MRKRLILCLAALVLLSLALSSCASSGALLTFGKTRVDGYMYRYFASSYKGIYARALQDYSDTDAFWDRELADGKTVAETLDGEILSNVRRTLICAELFDRLGFRLSEDRIRSVDDRMDLLLTEYADGSVQKLNSLLLPYGVNREILRKIYLMEEKVDALEEKLFSSGGELEITDAERDEFYRSHYVRVRLIFLQTETFIATDEEGNPLYDATTGSYVLVQLSEEEKEERNRLIATLEETLTADGFDAAEREYSELNAAYIGRAFTLDSFTASLSFLYEAASSASVGEIVKASGESGVYFILRCELEDRGYLSETEADTFESFEARLRSEKYLAYLAGFEGEVRTEEEKIREYSIRFVQPNYSF